MVDSGASLSLDENQAERAEWGLTGVPAKKFDPAQKKRLAALFP
jgi:hypothetical protein